MNITKELFKRDFKNRMFQHQIYGLCKIIGGYSKTKEIKKRKTLFGPKEVVETYDVLTEIKMAYVNSLGEVTVGFIGGDFYFQERLKRTIEESHKLITTYNMIKDYTTEK